MKFGWQTRKEKILRGALILPAEKLKGIRMMNELADKALTISQKIARRKLRGLIILFALFALPALSAFAADPPAGQEPGPQAERFKADTELERERLEKKKLKAPDIEIEEKKEEAPVAIGPKFLLKSVKITGATVFTPEQLGPAYAPFLNTEVRFAQLEEITEKIKAGYKKKGYLTTTAVVPEQDILAGNVEIRVVEGKMGGLSIEGNKWFSSPLIEKFFHSKKNEILDFNILQRDILRLNKNPDLEVKTVISAGKEPETSEVILKVSEKFPQHIGATVDNKGSRLTGKWRPAFYLRSSNLTGSGDTVFINTLYTGNSFGESMNYNLPIGTYGTKFTLDATYYKMRLGKEYKAFDITGKTQICTPRFSWELALREDFEAYLDAGMDIKSIKKKTDGTITSNDQLRLPFFGFDFTKVDSLGGQTSFSPNFIFSTEHFWGASDKNHPTSSRAGTGGFFFKYEQGVSRFQAMPWQSYLSVSSQFQAASHTLPSSEQIQLGGADTIRGYPEGDYLADLGGYMSCDWVFPNPLIPADWKLSGQQAALRQQIQPAIFFDIGGGELKKVNSGERQKKFLVGIGGGFRIRMFKSFLKLDWAKRLGDRQTGGSGPSTFYLTFQSEI